MLDKTGKNIFSKDFVFFRKMSHSAENLKGDPLGFINIHSVAKYKKLEWTTLLRHFLTFEKVARCRKKNRKGGWFCRLR